MAACAAPKVLLTIVVVTGMITGMKNVKANWCVARSDADDNSLQRGLDFACGQGTDCTAIHTGGTCFEPDTIQSHASYAFNSYFQRKGQVLDSCDFGGVANITTIDPSYQSCVYPSSNSSIAGGAM